MTQKSKYNKDLMAGALEVYLANPKLTLVELSEKSEELLGQKITLDSLKDVAAAEKWAVKRSAVVPDDSTDEIVQEVMTIRRILFEQIVNESRSGLMITGENLDKEEIGRRLTGLDLEVAEVSPRGVDAQVINAYMNCLAKTGISIKGLGSSAKTSHQQALEVVREAMEDMP